MDKIKIKNLQKTYKNTQVLNIDNFSFKEGYSYLLLGENGSGKSTLIKIILSLVKSNQGKVSGNFTSTGYLPEHVYLPSFLTVKEFLKTIGKIRNVENLNSKISTALRLWNLNNNKLLSHLSKGMVQKLMIIQALIHNPDLLIFDEPLNGLDIKSQDIFKNIINNIRSKEKTIIITTHFAKHYENLYDKLLYIHEGKINEKSI